jgi:hypothetical protein
MTSNDGGCVPCGKTFVAVKLLGKTQCVPGLMAVGTLIKTKQYEVCGRWRYSLLAYLESVCRIIGND